MKKLLLFTICLSVIFTACKDDSALESNEQSIDLNSVIRSKDEALELANQYCQSLKPEKSRSRTLTIDESSIDSITSSRSRYTSETLIYAINFTNNNGFLLISASKDTEPILAIVENGNYQESNQSDNGGYNLFIAAASDYVTSAIDESIAKLKSAYYSESPELTMVSKSDTIKMMFCSGNRIKTNWNQRWPEGMFCPNKIAGCTPVAIAQILGYFKPNLTFNLTFDGRPYDTLYVNWDEILKHTNSINSCFDIAIQQHLSNCPASENAHIMLGCLTRHLGVLCNASYKPESTSSSSYGFDVTTSLLDNPQYVDVHGDHFYNNLKDGGVALLYGATGKSAHSWVMDGTASIVYKITTYYDYVPSTGQYSSKTVEEQRSYYLHCNWGWGGSQNGYFLEGVYDTSKGDPSIGLITPSSRSNYYLNVHGRVFK